jgi:hypothetical protein
LIDFTRSSYYKLRNVGTSALAHFDASCIYRKIKPIDLEQIEQFLNRKCIFEGPLQYGGGKP